VFGVEAVNRFLEIQASTAHPAAQRQAGVAIGPDGENAVALEIGNEAAMSCDRLEQGGEVFG